MIFKGSDIGISGDTLSVLFTRHYPGYIYRREMVKGMPDFEGDTQDHRYNTVRCYSDFNGVYMGRPETARLVCKTYGIRKVQTIKDKDSICSIGFNEAEQKWYGWSHRAIYGFGIGSTCKEGDCGYTSDSVDKLYDDTTKPDSEGYAWQKPENVKKVEGGIEISHGMSRYVGDNPDGSLILEPCGPDIQFIATGRGEWEAHSLDDAKLMAIDFADGVS